MVCLTDTKTVKSFMKQLKDAGCEVMEDYKDACIVEAKDGDTVVYKGIQKGRGQPWIVRTNSTERIKWN